MVFAQLARTNDSFFSSFNRINLTKTSCSRSYSKQGSTWTAHICPGQRTNSVFFQSAELNENLTATVPYIFASIMAWYRSCKLENLVRVTRFESIQKENHQFSNIGTILTFKLKIFSFDSCYDKTVRDVVHISIHLISKLFPHSGASGLYSLVLTYQNIR